MLSVLRKATTIGILACAASGVVYADWTATGTFLYIDREFDQNGFTGVEPSLPIRSALVEVRSGNTVLATGFTQANGSFSIPVTDDKKRTVYVRVLSTSTGMATLYLKVENVQNPIGPIAVASPSVPNHQPNTNQNFGTVTAAIGSGGEAFNIYDMGLRAIDYFAALNGARPGASDLLTLEWEPGTGTGSVYDPANKRIHVGDPAPYDDTVILHETGHYAFDLVSASDSPGGGHQLSNCNQDIRLAYEEGRATWYGQSVRRYFGLPRPDLYVKTTGAPGPGNLAFYFNVESESPYYCDGAASEVAVYAALWDINDASGTADETPGVDDDTLERPDADNWDVDKNYILTAVNRSLEDFWDGWFTRGKGFKSDMEATFDLTNVEFFHDSGEPNNTFATALFNSGAGNTIHLTYFADPNGDGVGETDNDYFSFTAASGIPFTIETFNLWGDANTSLELLDSNETVLASSSSLINYTPAASGTLYVRSFHAPTALGVYGSYDFRITAPVDNDGDMYSSLVDCNDNDASIHPGATEICDGVDQDCDEIRDNGFPDGDEDDWASCGGDCNDSNGSVHPGATEVCNGIDDNCAGGIDEGFDADSDDYTTCEGDCNDSNPLINPGVTEICNGIDDDCDGPVDEGFPDSDGDGRVDCADNCPNTFNPNQTNADHDGAGDVCDYCTDTDGDSYGDPGYPVNTCQEDCGPSRSDVYPGAPEGPAYPETCYDGVDNDCDGGVDADCGILPTNQLPSSPAEGLAGGSLSSLGGDPDGNAYFSLYENGTSGAKRLTRIFQFDNMPTDVPMKLFVEGYRSSSTADNFNIRYTTVIAGTCPVGTGTAGWTLAALTITASMPDNGTLQSVVLPASSNPIWCVRIQDSIRSQDSAADWVNLDMFVLKPNGMAPP